MSVNIPELGLTGPLTLKRIYVVETANPARNQTETHSLYFKNLQALGNVGAATVQLTIGSTSLLKDGVPTAMDVAPTIINDRTMVPIRFVSEALGAQAEWRGQSQTAVIAYGGTVLELPVNQPVMMINGVSTATDVPAQLINDRTMVPLRAVSEGLGLTVDYAAETQTITIH